MSRWTDVLSALSLVVVAAVLAIVVDRPVPSPPSLVIGAVHGECTPARPTWLDGRPLPDGVIHIWSDGAIRARACVPATLSFTAQGTQALGVSARLTVTEGGTTKVSTQVTSARRFSVDVTPGAWVMIAFVNDLQRGAEDRNLILSRISFTPR